MDAAPVTAVHALRSQILNRRARLESTARSVSDAYLNELLAEVDLALQRIDTGAYGLCEACHDAIEPDRLRCNPLTRFCIDHLSEQELRAHEQDLNLASRIQTRLLPPANPGLSDWDVHYQYEPAGAVGGDYCELIALDGGQSLFFAVGDVAGKGVAASLLMTHLSAIFRSLLSMELPLAEVMARANRLFNEGTAETHYATLVCARANAQGIELCNAGHCAPLLLRAEKTQRMESTAMPLGIFYGLQFPVTYLTLDPGESLVLYSDGITETHDPAGREYGADRLADAARSCSALSAAAISEGILRDVAAFRDGAAPSDDVTLLVVRRPR